MVFLFQQNLSAVDLDIVTDSRIREDDLRVSASSDTFFSPSLRRKSSNLFDMLFSAGRSDREAAICAHAWYIIRNIMPRRVVGIGNDSTGTL